MQLEAKILAHFIIRVCREYAALSEAGRWLCGAAVHIEWHPQFSSETYGKSLTPVALIFRECHREASEAPEPESHGDHFPSTNEL